MEAQQTSPRGLQQFLAPLRTALLGRQNERLDYVMDSYFKLSPEGRTGVLVGGCFGILLFLIGTVVLYLTALTSLQANLDRAFEATNKVSEAKYRHSITKQKFTALEQKLDAANQNLTLIPFLETKAKEVGVTTSGFPAQFTASEITNPALSGKYQNAKVPFRIANASLKKIVDYVIAIESSPHMLKVSELSIKAQFQNKLFFDASLTVEGTVAKR